MRLGQPGQSYQWRVAVFVAVVGLHFGVVLLLFVPGSVRIASLHADAPLLLLSLSEVSVPRLSASPQASSGLPLLNRRESSRDIAPPPEFTEAEPNNAITLPLDLSADADVAARRQSDKEKSEKRWRNLAGPSDSQLEWWRNNVPLVRDHVLGDTEHAEGGELITWLNDKCYFTTHGIATFGMPQTSKVCKDPPKPETELFKDMRKRLDDSAKGLAP
jgi:hypothetical protein